MEREELIRAIGEPMRLRILELLTRRQYCVRSLARMLGISEPAVSQHLRVMREAGLVTVEKLGYHSHYRLVPEALEQLGEQFMQLAEAARKAPMEETGHGCGRRHMLAAEMGEPGFHKRCHGHGPEEHRPHGECGCHGHGPEEHRPHGECGCHGHGPEEHRPHGECGCHGHGLEEHRPHGECGCHGHGPEEHRPHEGCGCHGHEPEEHRPHGKCRRPEKPEGCPGPEACECHTHKEMEE